jgi:hypothetical protein
MRLRQCLNFCCTIALAALKKRQNNGVFSPRGFPRATPTDFFG